MGEELASDGVAAQVATIYEQFLHRFDTIYVASFLQETQKRDEMNLQQGQSHPKNPAMPPQPPPSTGLTSDFPGNPPYTFHQMIPFAYITAAELKMRGINEQFIAHIEEKRPYLQRFIEQY